MERYSNNEIIIMQNWIPLSIDSKALNASIRLLHQAAQFVAMVSNSYLSKQPDDSQNNFAWNNENNHLEGQWIKSTTVRALLNVADFELIIDKYLTLEVVPLDGWTKEQIVGNLQEELMTTTLNPSSLKLVTQFSIPSHSVDDGLPLAKPANELLDEWSRYLSNTQFLLKEIQQRFKWSSEIKVWPHHFDMGFYIPLIKDEQGNAIQSIGLGLAIPDGYVDEPYFFINHWSKNPIEYPEHFPKVSYGSWNTRDWKGLVLPANEVIAQRDQHTFVKSFYDEGINASLQLLNKSKSSIIIS